VPSVAFHTLGCKLNFAETGTIAQQFRQRDWQVVDLGLAADVVVLNTCTVTEEADRKARQTIRRALRANPEACVIVTGCFAQLRPEQVSEIDGVDVVLGATEKFDVFRYVDAFRKYEETQISVSCIDEVTDFGAAVSSTERTRAFLKVQDGCDYTCSFCTIPAARGRSRSANIGDIVAQASSLAKDGFSEIVLSGVNIGLFGQDKGDDLLGLLRALDAVEGMERYRISSIEPNLLTNDIIAFVASSRAFMPHFHIPLQSGDNAVLGDMRRRYRREVYTDRVEHIKSVMPHAAIGADVIVGFPTETRESFETTRSFLTGLPVSYLHVFTYSERPGTVAVDTLGGSPVPKPERSQRNRELRMLSAKKQTAFYREHAGTQRDVLWERAAEGDLQTGFTDNHVRVEAPYNPKRVGRVERIHLGPPTENGRLSEWDGIRPEYVLA